MLNHILCYATSFYWVINIQRQCTVICFVNLLDIRNIGYGRLNWNPLLNLRDIQKWNAQDNTENRERLKSEHGKDWKRKMKQQCSTGFEQDDSDVPNLQIIWVRKNFKCWVLIWWLSIFLIYEVNNQEIEVNWNFLNEIRNCWRSENIFWYWVRDRGVIANLENLFKYSVSTIPHI